MLILVACKHCPMQPPPRARESAWPSCVSIQDNRLENACLCDPKGNPWMQESKMAEMRKRIVITRQLPPCVTNQPELAIHFKFVQCSPGGGKQKYQTQATTHCIGAVQSFHTKLIQPFRVTARIARVRQRRNSSSATQSDDEGCRARETPMLDSACENFSNVKQFTTETADNV